MRACIPKPPIKVQQVLYRFAGRAARLRQSAPGSGLQIQVQIYSIENCSRPCRDQHSFYVQGLISSMLLCAPRANSGQGGWASASSRCVWTLPAPLIPGNTLVQAFERPWKKTPRFQRKPNCWAILVQPQAAVIQQGRSARLAGRAHPVAERGSLRRQAPM